MIVLSSYSWHHTKLFNDCDTTAGTVAHKRIRNLIFDVILKIIY